MIPGATQQRSSSWRFLLSAKQWSRVCKRIAIVKNAALLQHASSGGEKASGNTRKNGLPVTNMQSMTSCCQGALKLEGGRKLKQREGVCCTSRPSQGMLSYNLSCQICVVAGSSSLTICQLLGSDNLSLDLYLFFQLLCSFKVDSRTSLSHCQWPSYECLGVCTQQKPGWG